MSSGSSAAGLAFAVASLAACGHVAPKPPSIDAHLAVKVNVPDARVYVDEKFLGRAADLAGGAPITSGKKRVEIRADGWFAAYRSVPVAPGGSASVEVTLRRVPEGEPPE